MFIYTLSDIIGVTLVGVALLLVVLIYLGDLLDKLIRKVFKK